MSAPSTPCREWQGWISDQGYAMRRRDGRNQRVHRAVMALVHGDDAIAGRVVMHLCDNRRCFRYDHLRIGTQADNMRDMSAKGRSAIPKASKLSPDDVRDVRRRAAAGEPHRSIARRYRLAENTVWKIANRRTWKHVPDQEVLAHATP